MAEEGAEATFKQQMQGEHEVLAEACNGGDDATGDNLPSNTEHNNQQGMKESVADHQVLRAVSPPGADVESDEDYEPPAVTLLPAVTLTAEEDISRTGSRSPKRRPKTIGGFLADDSDDDNDAPTPSSVTGLLQPITNIRSRSVTPFPLQNAFTQQDLQNQVDSEVAVSDNANAYIAAHATVLPANVPKARLPHDRSGILEDRIKEDPRGDLEAWFSLIDEHRKRNKLEDARAVYERFFKIFPQAAEVWVAYIEMELENDHFAGAEQIFGKCLLTVPNVQLWSVYLKYIRRMNDVNNDPSGTARATVSQAYEFVLDNIGVDMASGEIWQEYIQFIKSGPGQVGGTNWQDQQKMDHLRKAYHRAIVVPMSSLATLWREYDQFEMNLNKMTGRKFLQERSPGYMTARASNTALDNMTRQLERTTIPRLPPALGFEGDQDYIAQVQLWKRLIAWEQEDPLQFREENELEKYKKRVLYMYKQAVMVLRFWPETWVDAADWCYGNGLDKDGDSFLTEGIAANPESCVIAFKKADRLESSFSSEGAEMRLAEKGTIVRAPYDKLLDTLYTMTNDLKIRETKEQAKIEESVAIDASISAIIKEADEEDDDTGEAAAREAAKAAKFQAIHQGYENQTQLLKRTISFVWVALMRAMRRVQGKGAAKAQIGGSRNVFAEARKRGKLTSDVYIASALMEWHVYKDPAGTKIFERGIKLYPEDEGFILEYLKHLISLGDTTNARVAFETAVSRLTSKSETVYKAKPLYAYFHKYEAQYGELAQINKLEQRMTELFPEDPKLHHFAARFKGDSFDPTAIRPIVSPAAQMRPKAILQSVEQSSLPDTPRPAYARSPSPRPQYPQTGVNSPKRAMPFDEFDDRPRKLARGESPLKGAAGRRLDQQKRMQGTPNWQSSGPAPFVIPRDITFMLSLLPRAEFWTPDLQRTNASALVRLLANVYISDDPNWRQQKKNEWELNRRYHGTTSNIQPPKQQPHLRTASQSRLQVRKEYIAGRDDLNASCALSSPFQSFHSGQRVSSVARGPGHPTMQRHVEVGYLRPGLIRSGYVDGYNISAADRDSHLGSGSAQTYYPYNLRSDSANTDISGYTYR